MDKGIDIVEYNPIIGLVDYGISTDDYATKMRCKSCGGAWLAENYVGGTDVCPKCGESGKNVMFAPTF